MLLYHTAAQQIIGREGETATLLSTSLFTLNLREFGFAPRHLNRWAASRYLQAIIFVTKIPCAVLA
jgi:hypothetical protein